MKKGKNFKGQLFIIMLSGIMSVFSATFAQNSPWAQKADMPTGRHSFGACVVDWKIYAAGGRYTGNLLTEYDPATDTWATKANMPTSRMALAAAAANGKVYAMGGVMAAYQPAVHAMQEYDPVTDTWTRKEDMPTARLGLGASVVDGKIYAIGGMTSGSDFWSGMQSAVEVYDPLTDTWSTGADMPTARLWFTTSVVDGKIYAIGGALLSTEPLATVEMYDPQTDTWKIKTPMPTARTAHAAAVIDGMIYIFGGGTHSGNNFYEVEVYDPETDTWTKRADMPELKSFYSANTIGEKIYLFGGIPNFANPHLHGAETVYSYDPSRDLAGLISQFNINKCFMEAGSDSVCITVKLNDPTGVTLSADIQAPDQVAVETLELVDDGNHNDGNAGDSLYANKWFVSPTEEQIYFVDLEITKGDTEPVVQRMDNVAAFTTIGPILFENYTFSASDTEPNPGDKLNIKFTLKNESESATATDIKARLISLNEFVTVSTDIYKSIKNIAANASAVSSYYSIEISDDCPVGTEIQFLLDITSNDISFWTDTFSITVEQLETMINENENIPIQFYLDQNYPNPFNPVTTIHFSVPVRYFVSLKVYDCLGQLIRTLISGITNPGTYAVEFDAQAFPSGLYFYTLQAGNRISTKKMMLVK